MVFELIDVPGPKARALSLYATFDYKKEAELEHLRNAHYAERHDQNYTPHSVFNFRLPFKPIDQKHILDECHLTTKAPKSLPEYSFLADYIVFSGRLKDAIVKLEEDAHQFFPLIVHSHDRVQTFDYFIIHSDARIECVDRVRSGFTRHIRPNGTEYWQQPVEPQTKFVRQSTIEGCHYWIDPGANATFFSGELIAILGQDFLPKGYGLKQVELI